MSWNARRYQITRHHLTPKSRGGKNSPDNLLRLTAERHQLWHKLFGLRTLEEVIDELIRIKRMKKR